MPGPDHLISLAGADITGMEFFLFGLIGCYVGVFSYNGSIRVTVNVDKKMGVDQKALANLFFPCFEEIYESICGDGIDF